MKDLAKMLMSKKDSSKMDEKSIQAKMDVLQELMDMCKEQMSSKVKSGMDEMRKVTVAAPTQEGLEEGLEKAQELTEEMPEEMAASDMEKEDEPKSETYTSMMEDEEDEDSIFAKKKS